MRIKAQKINRVALAVIYLMVALVFVLIVGMVGDILITGLPNVSATFLFSPAESMGEGGGIRDQLVNSLYLLVLTLLISTPLALGAGIYLVEYAPQNLVTKTVRAAIEVLSSLPSIVIGLFGYLFFVVKFGIGFSVLAGAMALTFFNLPLLTRNCEEALAQVPRDHRAGGLALGLSRWKTVTKIMLPEAIPGILTGVILSAGRVFGEAAALIYTAGQSVPAVSYTNWNPLSADSFLNPLRPAETLAVHIWKLNSEGLVTNAHQIASGTAAVLVIVILVFNIGARLVGWRLRRRLGQ